MRLPEHIRESTPAHTLPMNTSNNGSFQTSINARRLLAVCIIVVGCAVMTGWLTQAEILRALAPRIGSMLFTTALCLTLISTGLLLLNIAHTRWQNFLPTLLGLTAAILAGLTLAEHFYQINLGVDFPDLHRWLQVGVPYPGRMSTGTSTGILLMGLALSLWPLAGRAYVGRVMQGLVLISMLVAVFGLIIRQMDIEFLYSRHVISTMAVPTALCIMLAGAGLWLAWYREPWNRLLTFRSDSERIISLGTLILLAITVGACFAGLYTIDKAVDENIKKNQEITLKARERLVATVIENRAALAYAVTTSPEVIDVLRQINKNPGDAATIKRLAAIAESRLRTGFAGLRFIGIDEVEITQAGNFIDNPGHAQTLGGESPGRLLWRNGFHLRTNFTVYEGGEKLGVIIAEQPLTHLTETFLDINDFHNSGEIELCGLLPDRRASCFPTRLNSKPYVYPKVTDDRVYPIYLALARETGSTYGRDYRSARVFASFAPVADYSLGITMKVVVSELSEPVRREVEKTLPMLLILTAVGIVLLNLLVHPLTRKLSNREQQLKLALDNSGLALWDWNKATNRIYLSEQWQEMLGGKPQITLVTFTELQKLVHPDDMPDVTQKFRDAVKNGSNYEIEHRVRTLSGEWKWIRSLGKVVERDQNGQVTRMTGTNADVTHRKQAEEKLSYQAQHDALTGLPNRVLFYDRLSRAMARSARGNALMAVMYLDIDKFKTINDTLGHAMGDALLKEFSQRLQGCVRNVDTVARLGGDEYAVILEELRTREDGSAIAEKIVVAMRPAFTLESRTLNITTSVGISFHQGEAGVAADDLVKKADAALYKAKSAGRNNYQIAT